MVWSSTLRSFMLMIITMVGFQCDYVRRENYPHNVTIGVILEDHHGEERRLLKDAIKRVRTEANLLPYTELIVHRQRLTSSSAFEIVESACRLYEKAPAAIISVTSCRSTEALQSATNAFMMPHIQISFEPCPMKNDEFTLSMNPNILVTDVALFSLVKSQEWTQVIIFYDTDTAFHRVHLILEIADRSNIVWNVILFKYVSIKEDFKRTRKQLLGLEDAQHFLVVCDVDNAFELLQVAGDLGMRSRDNHWIVLNQGITDSQLEAVPAASGIVILLRQQNAYIDIDDNVTKRRTRKKNSHISSSEMYLHDATVTLATAFDNVMRYRHGFKWPKVDLGICRLLKADHPNERRPSIYHTSDNNRYFLMDTIRTTILENGLSGTVKFNAGGYNDRHSMEIVSVSSTVGNITDITTIGSWDPVNQLNMSHMPFQSTFQALENRTLRVVTILEEPFVRKTEVDDGLFEFSGFCIDILNEIARRLNFKYTIYEVPDNKYGAKVNGTWDGLVGEVAYGRADMAVAGITIMAEREEVVDFTKPYYQYALGVIIRRPGRQRGIFAFMEPLSEAVWGCIAAALFVVGILLFIVARFSPYSSYNIAKMHVCDCKGDDFNLKNSYWFALASLMNQGGDTAPYSISGRLLSGFWWFFTLIIIATYTANLTAFLTVSRMETPISSVEELSRQSKIKYGTIRDSSVVSFFKRSTINPYQRMWQFMSTLEDEAFVDDVHAGYRRVKNEDYAFMWDYPVLELEHRKDCELMTVGKPFYEKGYGFVTPEGAQWRDDISMSILEMREDGLLERYRKKTWELESVCEDEAAKIRTSTNEIDIQSVVGVFYILIMGAALSLILVLVELLYYHRLRQCFRPTVTVHPNADGKAIEVKEDSNAVEDKRSLSNSRV